MKHSELEANIYKTGNYKIRGESVNLGIKMQNKSNGKNDSDDCPEGILKNWIDYHEAMSAKQTIEIYNLSLDISMKFWQPLQKKKKKKKKNHQKSLQKRERFLFEYY